jgi:hypothetical protein
LRILPRLLFTILAITADFYFFRLCKTVFHKGSQRSDLRTEHYRGYITRSASSRYLLSAHQYAFVLHVLSWSLSYCLPRTLGNSLETCLLIIGTSLLFPPDNASLYWNNTVLRLWRREATNDDDDGLEIISPLGVAIAVTSVYVRPTAVLIWVSSCKSVGLEPSPVQLLPILCCFCAGSADGV